MFKTYQFEGIKFDVIQTNTTDVGTPYGAHVSNLSFIAAYSGVRNFRVFITSDIFGAINFRGCTLKPTNLNRVKFICWFTVAITCNLSLLQKKKSDKCPLTRSIRVFYLSRPKARIMKIIIINKSFVMAGLDFRSHAVLVLEHYYNAAS